MPTGTETSRHGHRIGGAESFPDHGQWLSVRSPVTGELLAEVPRGDERDIDAAVTAAATAFRGWRRSTPRERAELIARLADRMDAGTAELAEVEAANTGKPIETARAEIGNCTDVLRFFAGAARTLAATAAGEYQAGATSMVRRDPIGVIGAIVPWNYPLLMVAYKLGPALAAGNTLVIKPSELTPITALKLAELAEDILPPGVLNVVCGEGEPAGRALCSHPEVRLVAVTGSVATGRAVAAAAGIKPTHLELGGKAPVVVLEDADPGEVAAALRVAGYWNSGQDCMAACRVIAAAPIKAPLLEALTAEAAAIAVGPPHAAGVEMGPVISTGHRERVLGMVDQARRDGYRITTGGGSIEGPGAFLAPTVVDDPAQGSGIVQNEVFGPVVSVQAARDPAQALAWANGVPYGLAASVWTGDVGRAMAFARDLDFGGDWINDHALTTPEMPHAGRGASGHGTDMSVDALLEFTAVKHVMARIREL